MEGRLTTPLIPRKHLRSPNKPRLARAHNWRLYRETDETHNAFTKKKYSIRNS